MKLGTILCGLRKPLKPALTEEMRKAGLMWAKVGGEWREVCNFCGGNCGQCGITGRIGNVPFSLERMISKVEAGQ